MTKQVVSITSIEKYNVPVEKNRLWTVGDTRMLSLRRRGTTRTYKYRTS